MRRRFSAIAIAALLLIAGCSAPVPGPNPDSASRSTTVGEPSQATGTPAGGTTGTDSAVTTRDNGSATGASTGAIEVRNGSLPVNASRVFERVTRLLGVNVTPPRQINIQGHDSMATETRGLPQFAQTMGIGGQSGSHEVAAAGVTRGPNYVALNARIVDDPDQTRRVLVHEFVHVVQYRRGSIETAYRNINPGSTDSQMTQLAVVEGIPVFVEDAYARAYGHGTPTGMDEMVNAYRTADGVRKYGLAPYSFGAQYAEERAGNASQVHAIYEAPPKTTEAVIHGYLPGEEPIRELRTNVTTGSWHWSDRDRLGELFVRQVLLTELERDGAAVAAAGWGVDRQLTFANETATAYVWALRWDTETDAAEFERAIRTYLSDRGSKRDGIWRTNGTSFRLVRTNPGVVVLVIGPDAFVRDTRISGTNETVTVVAGSAA